MPSNSSLKIKSFEDVKLSTKDNNNKKSSNPQKVVGLSRVAHKTPSVLYLLPYLSQSM